VKPSFNVFALMQTDIEYGYCNDFVKVIARKDSEDCIKKWKPTQINLFWKTQLLRLQWGHTLWVPVQCPCQWSFLTARKRSGPKSRADHITISALWQHQYCSNSSPENACVKHIRNAERVRKIIW